MLVLLWRDARSYARTGQPSIADPPVPSLRHSAAILPPVDFAQASVPPQDGAGRTRVARELRLARMRFPGGPVPPLPKFVPIADTSTRTSEPQGARATSMILVPLSI